MVQQLTSSSHEVVEATRYDAAILCALKIALFLLLLLLHQVLYKRESTGYGILIPQ
jgi:hypothetical protein